MLYMCDYSWGLVFLLLTFTFLFYFNLYEIIDWFSSIELSSRFQDWNSEKTCEGHYSNNNGINSGKFTFAINSFPEKFQRGVESGSERIKAIRKSFKSSSFNHVVRKGFGSSKKVLDPQGPFLQRWNKIFVLSCIIAVSVDPLFFYVPVVNDDKKCLALDEKMETTACVLRSFTDIFYIIHIIFQFRTGFIAPSSRVFGRGVLVEDSQAIAKRYLRSYFLIDVLAVLPLPQVSKPFRPMKCSSLVFCRFMCDRSYSI